MSEWDAFPTVGPAKPAARPAPQRQAISFSDDNDALVRTVIGEARGEPPEGRQAVAAVIRNRAKQRGLTPSQVVLERNQFEPWGNPETARGLMGINTNDPLYQEVAQQIADGTDPTGGASHFYAPKAQAALGRAKPSWDDGSGRAIGNHVFFNLDGSPAASGTESGWDDFPEAVPGAPEAPAATAVAAPGSSRDNPLDLTDRNQAILAKKGDWVRLENGDLTRAAADAIEGAKGEQQGSGAFAYTPNAIDAIGAGALAASEQIPFLDESVAFTAGLATGEGYQAMRDRQAALRAVDNQAQRGARVAGGLAGFGAGLLAPGGAFIGRGANAGARAGRAAGIGAGYGGLYGAGAAEGGAGERVEAGLQGAAIGGLTGGVLQGGIDRLARGSTSAPSAARQLSREGVDLTPGQMMAEVPVMGSVVRNLEEGASSIPFVGAPIKAARERSMDTFNRAAVNRSLSPIGETLPKATRTGHDAIEAAQTALGDAYDKVLPNVTAKPDKAFYDSLSEVLNRSADEMDEPKVRQLASVIQNRVFRGLENSDSPMTGSMFKRIESELGALAREQTGALDPANKALGRSIEDIRTSVRDLVARQNPDEASRISDINRGYANLVRVENAALPTAEGIFSPAQLGMAARRGSGRSAGARGDALMQDLSSAGRRVLPSQVGDSGTATRGAITSVLAGGAAVANPGIALPTAAVTAAIYSRPVQSAINAVYRATDSRAANEGLQTLLDLARRDPALVPVYQSALDHVLGNQTAPSPTARPDVLSQAQAGMTVP